MNRFLVLVVVVGSFAVSASLSERGIGASSSCVNADCVVAASSSFGSILVALFIVLFVALFPQRITGVDTSRLVGIWRRLGGFFIDLILVLIVIAPLAALPILIAEAKYTGNFQWSFEREFARASDLIYILPGTVVAFVAWFCYLYEYARKNKPTVGQYTLNFTVTNDTNSKAPPKYALRVLFSALGLSAWPVSLVFALRSPVKQFWWDSASNTKVERIGA